MKSFTICIIFLKQSYFPLWILSPTSLKYSSTTWRPLPLPTTYVLGYFWGGDICRVNAVCVRSRVMQSLPSPAAPESCRTALRPSSGRALNCCSPSTPHTFHHMLAQHSYHLLLNSCLWRTYWFTTVLCSHIKFSSLSLFFLSEDILRVNDNVLLRLQSRANFFRELGSKFHKTKKTCCCCRWGCMQYNWCTFLVWGVWISFNCHHFGRSSKKKAIYIFIWGRCGSELCACTAMRNPFATSQSRCITSLVAPY